MTNIFVFRKNMTVGNPAAEDDADFLRACFVENGDTETIKDTASARSIILGRTGSGKSAIIQHILATEEHVIEIAPQALSLAYVSNSDVLRFFEKLGVNLDIFYQLLWRHILAVELIRARYVIHDETGARSFFANITSKLTRDSTKIEALNYLREWGHSFWLETESRVKEVTNSLESKLTSSVDAKIGPFHAGLSDIEKVTSEEKQEVVNRAQKVVNSIQMQALYQILQMLNDDIFDDPQKPYYIVIDKLDENWIDDPTRYKLIRALIEAIKTFRSVRNVKIIVALRSDLLERVFEHTRDSGFQAEKYEALILPLTWTREQLKELIDRRIDHLLRNLYTSAEVRFADVFPHKYRGTLTLDYMLDRTLMRPRDIIAFANECLAKAQGKTQITGKIIQSAEGTYSDKRFKALQDEWIVDHPLLREYCSVRKKRISSFVMADLKTEELDNLALSLITRRADKNLVDSLGQKAEEYYESKITARQFAAEWIATLYKIGVVGIKAESFASAQWSYESAPTISTNAIEPGAIIYVHPMLWRTLGIFEVTEQPD